LPDAYGVVPNSAAFHALTMAVRRRFEELRRMIEDDPELHDLKDDASKAIAAVAGFFNIENAGRGWTDLVTTHFRPEHLATLRFLSPSIRRRHPLKRLPEAERRKVFGEVQELLDDLRAGAGDLDPFVAKVLIEAFEDLLLVLEKFPFFGHAALADRIALAGVKLSTAEERTRQCMAPDAPTPSIFRRAAEALVLAMSLVSGPHALSMALPAYWDGAQELVGYSQELINHLSPPTPPETKALPAPKPKPIEDETAKPADLPDDEQP
jgi:hypothetical protein